MGRTTVAFVSDVHSNLEALQAVLAEVEGLDVYCLGDIVGYGASPNEVIKLLIERRATCLLGNHDNAAISGDVKEFNPRAAMVAMWTARQLTPESSSFLGSLPRERSMVLDGTRVYMAHGSPDDTMWEYVSPETHSDLFDHYLEKVGAEVIALGHTHVPFSWKGDRGRVFNPGSVGQPRDGDNRASYALLTLGGGGAEVEIRRVEYDIDGAAKRISAAGLPAYLAARLYSGG
jgi:predicted phosphodiesterase